MRRGGWLLAVVVVALVAVTVVFLPGRTTPRAAALGPLRTSPRTSSAAAASRSAVAAPGPAALHCPTPALKPLHAIPVSAATVSGSGRTVALTFDDGPSPTATPQVLAILKKNGIAATFFVTGRMVKKHPELVRAIVAEGSLVGNHTYHHDLPGTGGRFDRLPSAVIASEVDTTTAAITAAGSPTPCFFRAPGGYDRSSRMAALVRARGMTIVNWTYDPRDWAAPKTLSPSYQEKILKNATGTKPSVILLDHDGSDENFRGNTVAVLQRIIDFYRSAGFTFTDPVGRPLAGR